MLARHGSRGLSSYKYDALLKLMGETAARENGFVSEEARNTFMSNVQAIIDANVENGYGMLTGQGATQHRGIGTRAYQRNKALFDQAAADGETSNTSPPANSAPPSPVRTSSSALIQPPAISWPTPYVKPTAPGRRRRHSPVPEVPEHPVLP